MKKIVLAAVVCCIFLTGCSRHEEIKNPVVYPELNAYDTITDVELARNPEKYGFSKELTEEPDSFFYDTTEYGLLDFNSEYDLWQSLERINSGSSILNQGQFLTMSMMNKASDFEKQAAEMLTDIGSQYDFKFVPNSDDIMNKCGDTGLLGIRVYSNNEAGVVSDVEALFYGVDVDSLSVPILVYSQPELNVIKTSNDAPNKMFLCHYEEGTMAPVQRTAVMDEFAIDWDYTTKGSFELEVTKDTPFLDNAIDPKPTLTSDDTYVGVQLIEVAGQYIPSQDLFTYSNAAMAAVRIGQVMRGYWFNAESLEEIEITADTLPDELIDVIDEYGSILVDYYEPEGGNCRLTWFISKSGMSIKVFPTGNNTIPRTRVYYNNDFESPWIPYKYTHIMSIDFGE